MGTDAFEAHTNSHTQLKPGQSPRVMVGRYPGVSGLTASPRKVGQMGHICNRYDGVDAHDDTLTRAVMTAEHNSAFIEAPDSLLACQWTVSAQSFPNISIYLYLVTQGVTICE